MKKELPVASCQFPEGAGDPRLAAVAPMPSVSRDIFVSNKLGLHARPAMQFVDLANQFTSNVTVFKGGEEPAEADGKSVMQMIILAATEGTPLKIVADGEDAEDAVAKLVELFETKFGEED
jgi:phosphocarrier protein HPr